MWFMFPFLPQQTRAENNWGLTAVKHCAALAPPVPGRFCGADSGAVSL